MNDTQEPSFSRNFIQQLWEQRRLNHSNNWLISSESRLLHIVYSRGKRVYFIFMCTGVFSVVLILMALFLLLLPVGDDTYKKNSRMIHSIHLWEKGHFSEDLQKYNFILAMNKRNTTVQYPFKFNEQQSDIHENPFEILFKKEVRQYPSSYFSSESFSYDALLDSNRMKKIINVSKIESGDAICLSISSNNQGKIMSGTRTHPFRNSGADHSSNLFYNNSNCFLNIRKHLPGISFIPWHHRLADYQNLRKKNFCQTDEECLEFCMKNYVGVPYGNNQFLNLFIANEVCVVVKLDKEGKELRYVRGCFRNDSLENYVKVTRENIGRKVPMEFRLIIREEADPVLRAISISDSKENEPYIYHLSDFQVLSKIFFSVGAFLLIILASVSFYWKIKAKTSGASDQTRLLQDISVHSRSTAIAIQSPIASEVQSNARE